MTVRTSEEIQAPGLCMRVVNWEASQAGREREQVCGEPAVTHVAYDSDRENGFCCERHWVEFQAAWPYWDAHESKAPPCGYLGTLWDEDGKRCVWPEGHPLAEVSETVTVPA